MKANGHRACAGLIRAGQIEDARFLAHALILDNKGYECDYTQGFINEFNKAMKTLDNTNRK